MSTQRKSKISITEYIDTMRFLKIQLTYSIRPYICVYSIVPCIRLLSAIQESEIKKIGSVSHHSTFSYMVDFIKKTVHFTNN